MLRLCRRRCSLPLLSVGARHSSLDAFQGIHRGFACDESGAGFAELWARIEQHCKVRNAAAVVSECNPRPSKALLDNILLKLCARSWFKDARLLTNWMDEKKCFEVSDADKLLRLDVICHLGGSMQTIREMFDSLSHKTEAAYLIVLQGCCDSLKAKHAKIFLEEFKQSGQLQSAFAYTLMLKMYARLGQAEEAVKMFHEYRASGFSPDLRMYWTMLKHKDTIFKSVQVTEEAAEALKNTQVNHSNRREMMRMNAALGNSAAVDSIWSLTKMSPPLMASDYMAAIEAYDLLDKVSEAEEIGAELEKRRGDVAAKELCAAMLRLYTRHGLLDKAESVVERMQRERMTVDFEHCQVLIDGYLKLGKLDEAVGCFRRFAELGPNVRRPVKIVGGCISKLEQALAGSADVKRIVEDLLVRAPEASSVMRARV